MLIRFEIVVIKKSRKVYLAIIFQKGVYLFSFVFPLGISCYIKPDIAIFLFSEINRLSLLRIVSSYLISTGFQSYGVRMTKFYTNPYFIF